MRIEMYICWSDGTWTDCHYVTIPPDTPEGEIEEVAREVLSESPFRGSPVHFGVAHIETDHDEDDNEEEGT